MNSLKVILPSLKNNEQEFNIIMVIYTEDTKIVERFIKMGMKKQ